MQRTGRSTAEACTTRREGVVCGVSKELGLRLSCGTARPQSVGHSASPPRQENVTTSVMCVYVAGCACLINMRRFAWTGVDVENARVAVDGTTLAIQGGREWAKAPHGTMYE